MTRLLLLLLFTCCFTLATALAPAFQKMADKSGEAASPLLALLGDSRRLFANQFFTMADEYFHSGFYPTIFDHRKTGAESHLDVATHETDATTKGAAHEDDDDNFMGPPRDAFEAFGRHFIPTVHTHLETKNVREILPWLKLSAELDPNRIDTYVTASYWLRTRLTNYSQAEDFLRQGLRANPDSYEIYLELGRVYFSGAGNIVMARNLWEIGLRKWQEQEAAGKTPDPHVRDELLGELVRDDEKSGNLRELLEDLEALDKTSPGKVEVEKYISEVKQKLAKSGTAVPDAK